MGEENYINLIYNFQGIGNIIFVVSYGNNLVATTSKSNTHLIPPNQPRIQVKTIVICCCTLNMRKDIYYREVMEIMSDPNIKSMDRKEDSPRVIFRPTS